MKTSVAYLNFIGQFKKGNEVSLWKMVAEVASYKFGSGWLP